MIQYLLYSCNIADCTRLPEAKGTIAVITWFRQKRWERTTISTGICTDVIKAGVGLCKGRIIVLCCCIYTIQVHL